MEWKEVKDWVDELIDSESWNQEEELFQTEEENEMQPKEEELREIESEFEEDREEKRDRLQNEPEAEEYRNLDKSGSALSAEKERELIAKVKEDHDQESLKELIGANLYLVKKEARKPKYGNPETTLADRIHSGIIGLIKGINRFDFGKGCKLSTYATWYIRNEIQEAAFPASVHRGISKVMVTRISKIAKFESQYKLEHGKMPSDEEVMKELNLTEKQLENARREGVRIYTVSLDAIVTASEDAEHETLSDKISGSINEERDREEVPTVFRPESPEFHTETKQKNENLWVELSRLKDRERQVLLMLYGDEPMKIEQAAETLHLSVKRVKEIEREALSHLSKGEIWR